MYGMRQKPWKTQAPTRMILLQTAGRLTEYELEQRFLAFQNNMTHHAKESYLCKSLTWIKNNCVILHTALETCLCLEAKSCQLHIQDTSAYCGTNGKAKCHLLLLDQKKSHFNRRIRNEGYKCATCYSRFPKGPLIIEDKDRVHPLTFYLKVQTIETQGNKGRRNTLSHRHTHRAYVSSCNDPPMAAIVRLNKGSYQMFFSLFFYASFTFAICCSTPLTFLHTSTPPVLASKAFHQICECYCNT